MKVKICGQTSLEGSEASIRHGADFIGVALDVEWSPRSLSVEQAKPIFDAYGDRAFLLTFNAGLTAELMNAINTLQPYALQLTGQEPPETVTQMKAAVRIPVYKSIHLPGETLPGQTLPGQTGRADGNPDKIVALMESYAGAGADGFVLDTKTKTMFGGTGMKSDWALAGRIIEKAPGPVFLAGGINPGNVAQAIEVPGIYGIDLASGVESAKGVKSSAMLSDLFAVINRETGQA